MYMAQACSMASSELVMISCASFLLKQHRGHPVGARVRSKVASALVRLADSKWLSWRRKLDSQASLVVPPDSLRSRILRTRVCGFRRRLGLGA